MTSAPDRLAEAIAILRDLVAFPSVSSDSNLAIAAHLADRLERAGARTVLMPDETGQKANLLASFGPEGPGGILLSGHSDVVPVADQVWASDPFAMVERDGRLYGRGTCDMKGFLAAVTAVAPLFGAAARPLHIAVTHDEEIGCLGAKRLIPILAARGVTPEIALVGEPTSMRIVEGHKGCTEVTVRITGREGHGSAPGAGVNTAVVAARYVDELMRLSDALRNRAPTDCPFDPPWATVSVGRIAAGTAHNVIPGRAEIAWEMRAVQAGDTEFVLSAMAAFCAEVLLPAMRAVAPEAAIETEIVGDVVGLAPCEPNPARELAARLTGRNETALVAFNTEGGLFQGHGAATVVCGPGSIEQAHRPDEYLEIAELGRCVRMLERLSAEL